MLLSGLFFLGSAVFVWRSFYAMRIGRERPEVCSRAENL